jgi:hypothetical protein
VAGSEYCPPCPNCRHVLIEQRQHDRVGEKSNLTFTVDEEKRTAKVIDLSMDGARIAYKGDAIPIETILDFNLDRLNIHRPAMAVWTKQLNPKISQSGLRLL